MRIVCISDTHGKHADLDDVPDGDVLIHAGDYTTFGKEVHARAFNEWLGTLPHPHKLVVNGNHEANAPWLLYAAEILSNARNLAGASGGAPRIEHLLHSSRAACGRRRRPQGRRRAHAVVVPGRSSMATASVNAGVRRDYDEIVTHNGNLSET